jgi:protein TonB
MNKGVKSVNQNICYMLYWEPKKTTRADLDKARPLLFSISLLITMLFVIFAFEIKTYDEVVVKKELQRTNDFEEIIEVPPTEILPPPPSVQMPRIVEVPDAEEIKEEIKVEFDMEVTNETVTQEFTIVEQPVKVEEEEADKIFLIVEQNAAPRDGMSGFYKFVSDNIRYPGQARRMNVEGKVFVEFVVDKDGTLNQFTVVKGIGAGCDEEAIRVIQLSPPWSPGKQRGKPVRQRMILPIYFKLANRG